MKDETENWLESAVEDLNTARYNLEGNKNSAAMFFCQQAIEKCLKAIDIEEQGQYTYSHDLVELAAGKQLEERFMNVLADLTAAYTGIRYPDKPDTKIENPEETLSIVEEVVEWTKKQLQA